MGRGGGIWLAAALCPCWDLPRWLISCLGLHSHLSIWRYTVKSCLQSSTLSVSSPSRYYTPAVHHLHDPHRAEKLSGALWSLWGYSQPSQPAHTMTNMSTSFVLYYGRLNCFSRVFFTALGCDGPMFGVLTRGGSRLKWRKSVKSLIGWKHLYYSIKIVIQCMSSKNIQSPRRERCSPLSKRKGFGSVWDIHRNSKGGKMAISVWREKWMNSFLKNMILK